MAFVADDFAVGEGFIAYWEGVHVDITACFLDEFGEAVEVSASAVVVDRDDGVVVALDEAAYGVEDAFLHFGVRALDGVEFDFVAVFARVDA